MKLPARWECLLVVFVLVILVAGCKKTPRITLACEATPPVVYPGELVIVHAPAGSVSTGNRVNLLYKWSGPGVVANGETARVVTGSIVPGTYAVNAEVKEGKPGKEGQRPGESAHGPLLSPSRSLTLRPLAAREGNRSCPNCLGTTWINE